MRPYAEAAVSLRRVIFVVVVVIIFFRAVFVCWHCWTSAVLNFFFIYVIISFLNCLRERRVYVMRISISFCVMYCYRLSLKRENRRRGGGEKMLINASFPAAKIKIFLYVYTTAITRSFVLLRARYFMALRWNITDIITAGSFWKLPTIENLIVSLHILHTFSTTHKILDIE